MDPLKERDPQTVGPYTLLGRLGSGAMGRVFLGRAGDGTQAAIKVVHEHLANESSFRERFRREVEAARRVSGPRTAAVLDADPEADLPWMAVEYVEGPNLEQQVQAHGPIPAAHIFWLAGGIALALGEIHEAGVTHRDLKPTNVLLSPTGPRVIDFGIARSADASAMTTMGLVTGSPAYMSPEQAMSGTVTQASDVFCFGAVLFFAATGHPVFGSGPPAAMLFRVVHNDADLSVIADAELRALIEACLDKEPANRPSLASISAYANAPAGRRDAQVLAVAAAASSTQVLPLSPVTQVLPSAAETARYAPQPPTQVSPPVPSAGAYGGQQGQPNQAGQAWNAPPGNSYGRPPGSFGGPTQVGGPATAGAYGAGRGGPDDGNQVGRRSSAWPLAGVALIVIALIAGGFYVVQQVQKNGEPDAIRTPSPRGTESAPAVPTSKPAPTTTAPPTSAPATQPPASPTGDASVQPPFYLYKLASGVFGGTSGTRRPYLQDGFQSQDSTGLTVGCADGSPWSNQFRVVDGAKRITGTLLLDSQTTPDDLVVTVEMLVDGRKVKDWTLEPGDQKNVNQNIRGARTVEFTLVKAEGFCGLAPRAYAVLVDGQETT